MKTLNYYSTPSNEIPNFIDYEEVVVPSPIEEFKEIPGYNNYLIDESGFVYSKKVNRVISTPLYGGHRIACLYSNDGIRLTLQLRRLVAEAFLPNPHPEKYTDLVYQDHNPKNCHFSNLEWINDQENAVRLYELGIADPISNNVLTENDVQCIRATTGVPVNVLASAYGVHETTIRRVKNRTSWKNIE